MPQQNPLVKLLYATPLLATLAVFVGCNAVSGAGEDLQEASDNTSEAVEDATN